jgi:hypothetical protein
MLHEYHNIYGVQYYPWFHITVVGLGVYYPQIWGHYFTYTLLYTHTQNIPKLVTQNSAVRTSELEVPIW